MSDRSCRDVPQVHRNLWGPTGEVGAFAAELAQTFGPEEAERLACSKAPCAGHSTFGGPGPREK